MIINDLSNQDLPSREFLTIQISLLLSRKLINFDQFEQHKQINSN